MPFNNEITIQPYDLEKIIQQLKAISWSQGPVIIRDLGEAFQLRDKSEHHIFSFPKNEHDEPG